MSVPKWAIKRSLILKYCTECTDFVPATVVVGGFFGDEGKGKIISHLASIDSPRIVVRGGAGPNAGHTIKHGGKTFKVRMLPSGFLNESSEIMIGPGVVVDPNVLLGEIAEMQTGGRTYVDANCGIIEESHKVEDGAGRLKEMVIGSTGSGTGPANAARKNENLAAGKECDQTGRTDILQVAAMRHSENAKSCYGYLAAPNMTARLAKSKLNSAARLALPVTVPNSPHCRFSISFASSSPSIGPVPTLVT